MPKMYWLRFEGRGVKVKVATRSHHLLDVHQNVHEIWANAHETRDSLQQLKCSQVVLVY